MNSAESAALDLVCRERGWQRAPDGENADLVLINTCSVRATAEQRVMGRLALYASIKKKRLVEGKPLLLVLAGCMAQRLGTELQKSTPALDFVMGTGARSLFPLILEAAERGNTFETALDFPAETPVFSFSPSHLEEDQSGNGSFRSFVPIMHGCNNFCSYCIVPYVRGPEISRGPEAILDEIRLVGEKGVREIILLGQNVNSYRWEGLDFSGLLRRIVAGLENSPIKRLRFLSANPKDLSPETLRIMAENPVFCRHLHLPVQHGSDRILEAMNRRYTRAQYLALVEGLRRTMPEISLSTDILVGFPGETEEDIALTLDLMEEVKFLYAYTYHYNPREGTAACGLPGRIDEALKKERLSRVIDLQKKHT
jgi:tRNA-2-methylthio-N6-dimethylallyladenosine synthase